MQRVDAVANVRERPGRHADGGSTAVEEAVGVGLSPTKSSWVRLQPDSALCAVSSTRSFVSRSASRYGFANTSAPFSGAVYDAE